jgi:hypothetical protein
MRRDLIRRLEALEGRMLEEARPRKSGLPAWLLEKLVNQGARLDARGQLDLAWLREQGQSGGVPWSAN